ncbi:MAG: hypothetical protein KDC27_17070 [Acidobacteria bacterium]|nr:hypothetical protein [Acidobacteriota bacterium]
MSDAKPNPKLASEYIRSGFRPRDRHALFLLHRRSGGVIQRVVAAEDIASDETLQWLARKNSQGFEVYVGMNALKPEAQGRTKADIADIRHLYLDLDLEAEAALSSLQARDDTPEPNRVLDTSPGKLQVVWKVERFTLDEAESLQRQLAGEFGADPAATDAARVLRLPGFLNHKYEPPHPVGVRALSERIHQPADFGTLRERRQRDSAHRAPSAPRRVSPDHISQSERDWAYAKRELWRGKDPSAVADAIAEFRKGEKSDPRYYAERTVQRAGEALAAEGRSRQSGPDR